MERSRTREIIILLIATLLLAAGCSADTPAPGNKKPNTEINRETDTAVPPEVDVNPAPEETPKPGTEEKEEPAIVIPDWLRDKSYRMDNGNIIHFSEYGIPNISTDADIAIIAIDKDKVTYRVLDTEGNESTQYISSTDEGHSITILNEKRETAVLFLDIDGPSWLKNRTFIDLDTDARLEFSSRGLLVTAIPEHAFAYINSMDDDSVEFVYIDKEGLKESLFIERLANEDILASMGTETVTFESM